MIDNNINFKRLYHQLTLQSFLRFLKPLTILDTQLLKNISKCNDWYLNRFK
jgi:hypothetical protein